MEQVAWMLAGLLRAATRLLPPGRREWAEAVRAEADQVPAGRLRLHWLAGGLWLVARKANIVRKIVYWLGLAAVAATGAWAISLSWRASPATDPQVVTDQIRVMAGAAALVALPWLGRRRGWFGPVGSSIMARLVRVAGCAAMCVLGVMLVRADSGAGLGPHGPGPFSLYREITGLVLVGALLAAPLVIKASWPEADAFAVWSLPATASVVALGVLPVQILAIAYPAGILAATSRHSPVAYASLAAGTVAGVAWSLAGYGIASLTGDIGQAIILIVAVVTGLFAAAAGLAAGWLVSGIEDPKELRDARIRQGLLTGVVAGAAGGLVVTFLSLGAVFMMAIGPLLGVVGGLAGGGLAAEYPRRSRPDRSWAAGLFVLVRYR